MQHADPLEIQIQVCSFVTPTRPRLFSAGYVGDLVDYTVGLANK